VEYKSYAFTPVGVQLLELFQVETDDGFFMGLAEILERKLKECPVDVRLLTVEAAEGVEGMVR
jgi:hypothetical protein